MHNLLIITVSRPQIGDTDNAELATIITALTGATAGTAADVATYNMSALINPDSTDMLEDYYYYDVSYHSCTG